MASLWWFCSLLFSLGYHSKPVASTHFMGGHIRWRAVNPAAAPFDGRVFITHRIAWRRDTSEGMCSRETIEMENLIGRGSLICQTGCTGTIGTLNYYCTDYSEVDNWSAGERTYTYTFSNRSVMFFEALYAGTNWISVLVNGTLPSADWQLRVSGMLSQREDTGAINSAPVVNIPPQIRLQHGCSHTIKIPVQDPDGDYVRCRWAESSLNECGDVCRSFPASLDDRDCELQYEATGLTGRYAVALQVEDFASPADTTPLSSVPVQFLVLVFSSSQSCSSQPVLVGATPPDGSCVGVPFNSTWSTRITARIPHNSIATSITDIVTASPFGMRKSTLTQFINNGELEWYVNVTWTPPQSQYGPNIFCYSAMDNTNKASSQRCITLMVGVEPPMVVPGSMFPTEDVRFNSSYSVWSIRFDKQFIRPSRDRYIRIFEEGGQEVFSINVATSLAVTYPSDDQGRTLSFNIDYMYPFPERQRFYITLDKGVALSNQSCNHAESPAIEDPTVWAFTVADVTPPGIQINSPVITNEGMTLSWSYDEEASSLCKLQPPSTLDMIPVSCLNSSISITNTEEGYSLYIQSTDLEGNTASFQLMWNIVTITCGNIKLTDIELVQRSVDTATVNDATESSTTLYHCAEGVTTDNSVSSICSSDGVSRWNTDLANHGCTSSGASTDSAVKEECSHMITQISTPLAFVFGILCTLLVVFCVKCMCTLLKRSSARREGEDNVTTTAVNINSNDKGEDLISNDLYYEVVPTRYHSSDRTLQNSMELRENVAYGHFDK